MTWARGWGQANGWKGGELQRLEHVSGSIYSGEGAATYNLQALMMFRFEAYFGYFAKNSRGVSSLNCATTGRFHK